MLHKAIYSPENQRINMLAKQKNLYDLRNILRLRLSQSLPGMEAHKKMIPKFDGRTPKYFNDTQKLKEAAVLIVLFEEDSTIKTILIERVINSGHHSGQIAFPGGKKEKTDKNLIQTALRETKEEVGVSISEDSVIGELTAVQIPISGFKVLPIVAISDKISSFERCEQEVNDIFKVDLFSMLETEKLCSLYTSNKKVIAPAFTFDNHIVWGATAMVLSELKHIFNDVI